MNDLKDRLQEELHELAFIGVNFHLKAINGGAVNRCYRLETPRKHYFIKTFESDKTVLLDRKRLFDIQLELAAKGLAVQPVYLSKSQHFQIDSWLDMPTLDQSSLSHLSITKGLASALSVLHSTEIDAPALDLPQQWQHYMNVIDGPVSVAQQRIVDSCIAIWHQACTGKAVFCHNDLSSAHVTYAQPSKMFDWEYCALSCPYFDIASCVAINGFNSADEASLYTFYAQYSEQPLSEVIAKVNTMKPLVELTNRLWYQAVLQST